MTVDTRREFLHRSTGLIAAASLGHRFCGTSKAAQADAAKESYVPKVCCFTESFQDLPIPEVCRIFRELGLDGLDLTVRPGGHIDPSQANEKLPLAAKAAIEHDVRIMMLTTAITDADELAKDIFARCADAGIDRIKLGYYRYREFGNLKREMDEVRRRIESVVELAKPYQVLPCIHIHSGDTIPSHGTQLYQLISDIPPDRIGAYVDPLHMTLEGGGDGWRQGLDLLAPWIQLASIKNFWWEKLGKDGLGQRRWQSKTCPVAEGVASIPDFVRALRELGYAGFYSLHSEYQGGSSFRRLSTKECIEQTIIDLKFLKQVFASV